AIPMQNTVKRYNMLRLLLWSMCAVFLIKGCKGVKSRNIAVERADVEQEVKAYNFSQNFTTTYDILHNARLMLEAEEGAIFSSASKILRVRESVFDEPTRDGVPHRLLDSLIQKA